MESIKTNLQTNSINESLKEIVHEIAQSRISKLPISKPDLLKISFGGSSYSLGSLEIPLYQNKQKIGYIIANKNLNLLKRSRFPFYAVVILSGGDTFEFYRYNLERASMSITFETKNKWFQLLFNKHYGWKAKELISENVKIADLSYDGVLKILGRRLLFQKSPIYQIHWARGLKTPLYGMAFFRGLNRVVPKEIPLLLREEEILIYFLLRIYFVTHHLL